MATLPRQNVLFVSMCLAVSMLADHSAQAGFVGRKAAPAPEKSHDFHVETAETEISRLVGELKHSARSFDYLRQNGFSHTDEEFERMIAENPNILRSTRIIRRDESGNRIIPGWPAVALTWDLKK